MKSIQILKNAFFSCFFLIFAKIRLFSLFRPTRWFRPINLVNTCGKIYTRSIVYKIRLRFEQKWAEKETQPFKWRLGRVKKPRDYKILSHQRSYWVNMSGVVCNSDTIFYSDTAHVFQTVQYFHTHRQVS